MIFQIIKESKVVFWTEYESCIPSEDEIKTIKKYGYKIRKKEEKNGKSYNK